MALDGAFLRHLKNEIESVALGARVDRIYQPNKEEFVFSLRNKSGSCKLLMSTRANSARVHFTQYLPENPAVPPMLCMLFRKKLLSAKLVAVRQPDLERVLLLDFEAKNDLGENVALTVAIEIMGRYSNIILIESNGKIIDALKRVDAMTSSKRQVLPGLMYKLPPKQNKLSLLTDGVVSVLAEKINFEIISNRKSISDAIMSVVKGLSSIVCDKIEFELNAGKVLTLNEILSGLKYIIVTGEGAPFIAYDGGRPKDFSFIEPTQYDGKLNVKKLNSFSELLDEFFAQRDSIDRMKAKSHDLRRQINNIISKLKKKMKLQLQEIEINQNKDDLKLRADLINANIYRIKKGAAEVFLENFFDENLDKVKIKLNPNLSPAENATKLYIEYKKSKVAVAKLTQEVDKARQEVAYLETVLDEVDRAVTESDLSEIKNELFLGGYIKLNKVKDKKIKALPPIEYNLGEKIKVLVGRNNHQNDKLTLKMAAKKDLWFHVKDMPGSHTILAVDGTPIDEDILLKTAKIAAYHSKAKNSSNVPVDFAFVKEVKKAAGAKPGMVIYNNYKTLYVTPDENFMKTLKDL